MMKTITISDSLFLPYGRTAKLGGVNTDIEPSYFSWEATSAQDARFVTDSDIKRAPGHGQVAFLLETFFLHPEDYIWALEKPFEAVLTHNAYFARHKENWFWYPHGGSWIDFKDWGVRPKSKNVSVLCSRKQTLRGHKLFREFVEKFGERVDVYGLESYADKMDAIAPYRYSVVFEAEKNESFFSEKLLDCLALGTIPIYWGCPNIAEFFDVGGILQIDSFKRTGVVQVDTLDEMNICLSLATQEYYDYWLPSVKKNLETAKRYRLPEDWIYEHYPFLFEGA